MPMFLSRLMGAGVSPMLALVMGDDFTDNITATGTTQTDAFTISTATTRFTTVASGTGARLPNYNRGDSALVINDGANALHLYPAVGHSINSLATNVAISIPASSALWLDRVTNTKWAAGDATGVPFTPSGIASTIRTISDVENAIARSGDYASNANYLTRLAALTETIGVSRLNIQQSNGVRYQTSSGYGSFASHTLQSTFNGTIDNVLMFASYNIAEGTAGTKIVSSEPTWAMQMEADYNNGSAHLMEWNMDYASPSGVVSGRRFLGFTIDRATDKGTWTFSGDTFTYKDSTAANQWLVVNITSTNATLSVNAGTALQKETNNAQWLSQLNAAGSAYVEIARIDNSNQVSLAPAGGTTVTGGIVGIGGNASSARGLVVSLQPSGTQQGGVLVNSTFSSAATVSAQSFNSAPGTAAASFTAAEVIGFMATDVSKGAGSTITSQEGFRAANQTNGGSNIGFRGLVSTGTNKWNLYMDGTADNFLEGRIKYGATASAANNAQTVTVGNVGPGAAGISIQSWAKVLDSSGNLRYIPLFG